MKIIVRNITHGTIGLDIPISRFSLTMHDGKYLLKVSPSGLSTGLCAFNQTLREPIKSLDLYPHQNTQGLMWFRKGLLYQISNGYHFELADLV